ncbi:MAG: hypothetical protein M1825_001300 [Sarcosagium campestre]|nr:MAG: hypothetical protein M1825_001300 [Sarcosagium campestre]
MLQQSSPQPINRGRGSPSPQEVEMLRSSPYESTITARPPKVGKIPIKGNGKTPILSMEQAAQVIVGQRRIGSRSPSGSPSSKSPISGPQDVSITSVPADFNPARYSTSSPESRSLVGDEDETSSEAVEPVTPTSDIHPHELPEPSHVDNLASKDGSVDTPAEDAKGKPLLVRIPASPTPLRTPPKSPPKSPGHGEPLRVAKALETPQKPVSPTNSKKSASKRIASLFHRSHSSAAVAQTTEAQSKSGARINADTFRDVRPVPPPRRPSSFSLSARGTPWSSKSNSPPSPSSPSLTVDGEEICRESSEESMPPKPTRATTGFLSGERSGRIRFTSGAQLHPPIERRRSTSMTGMPLTQANNSISRPAETGVGLKARRMSTTLPDDFNVDIIELNKEFTSTSLVPGRRGKMVGSGATAQVKLMARKGGPSNQIFAVKEFRKKGKQEDEHDYVKKVKSEFTIAKSLDHPNIVTTVRLCTHSGRYNHVMEYCPQGELFSLVQRDYFKETDRLCLFKQLLRGVTYLHNHGIAHRDVKLENLLMTNDGHLKITDFGVSEVFCGDHPGVRAGGGVCGKNMKECRRCAPGICGSLPYIAPEVLEKDGDYDPRPLDVWSCAIVYFMMRFKGSPWASAERKDANYARFLKGWADFGAKKPEQLITDDSGLPKVGRCFFEGLESQGMRRLLLRMLHPVPHKRIAIQDALNDRWLKTIECCSPEPDDEPKANVNAQSGKASVRKTAIRKVHNHLPPTKRVLLHSFEIKEG